MTNKKRQNLIYIQFNESNRYVLSHGIEFSDFMKHCSTVLDNLLLLKHQFSDADFNGHTMLSYVPEERLGNLIKDDVHNYEEFCWIDFTEVASLNELSEMEIAELLYLGHLKRHLKAPFYNKLANNFVYLSRSDGWLNKVYYRDFTDFYNLLSRVIVERSSNANIEKRFFIFNKKRTYPLMASDVIAQLKSELKDGAVISFEDSVSTRSGIEVPIWVVGDFINMDKMYDQFARQSKQICDAKLTYDRKLKTWRICRQ